MTGRLEHAGVEYGGITPGRRGDGRAYSSRDREVFGTSSREVAKVIALSRRPGFETADTEPSRVAHVGDDA
jgi:hypothetical protein